MISLLLLLLLPFNIKQAGIKNTLADVVNNPLKGPNVKYRVIA
jgi:hypothetical protein